ncbi:hypothetical protein SAMN05878276_1518 [Aquipseudomonas alcaligenes]|nr:hypothetical protein SAMN05878276_1518 [Pseudomonas alcaligenes]
MLGMKGEVVVADFGHGEQRRYAQGNFEKIHTHPCLF